MKKIYIKWFKDIGIEDISEVGGKNASLGELYNEFKNQELSIPDGFAVTSEAFRVFLHSNKMEPFLKDCLDGLDVQDIKSLKDRSQKIRSIIEQSEIPEKIKHEIISAYYDLRDEMGNDVSVAVRSSATAEDLPQASFAGQQETFLNVQGDDALLVAVKKCFASLYTDRAISYRVNQGFDHLKVYLSVGIQRMVRSDLGSAGVMFSIDTESGFKDAVLINASYGLGENIVNGTVNPDEYVVFKTTLAEGFAPIIKKSLGSKEYKLIYESNGTKATKNIPVPIQDQNHFVLSRNEILTLSRWACKIEKHFSDKYGKMTPMDIEWAKDGITGELFLLQARPETIFRDSKESERLFIDEYILEDQSAVLLTGRSVGKKISNGTVRVIESASDLVQLKSGEVLVTDKTDPDWEPAMKRAAAIVTNRGGRTCHAAIVARELGIPAIVGTENGTKILKNNQLVTVSAASGSEGKVYSGILKFSVRHSPVNLDQKLKTKLMVILGNPEEAFRISQLPNDGVGLVRLEFMISSLVQVHPMAIARYPKLKDPWVVNEILKISEPYSSPEQFFVDQLSEGVGMIAAAFYPKEVIVRMSDFKSNEYCNLIGGKEFESVEENPMLGFRGASRYSHPKYRDGFALECKVMKKVRDEMGLKNLKLMIPFCRTIQEGKDVIAELAKNGLVRGENGLEVYVMCEIPSNVILADDFCEIFDGFSIGSNDLTQLILGVDRDSELVAPIFDESNPAVLKMISNVIHAVRLKNRKIGICGQAPSDNPEFTKFLIGEKIDSISLNPDSLLNGYQQLI
jgi:pyruvate,water dikinase